MRKAVFILLLVAATAQPASAQATAWANKIFAGDVVHDFGVVPRGAQLKYAFKMTNIYKVPLELTEVRAECGCVTFKETTKILQPGETGTLNINMDSSRFSGQKSVKIHVTVGPQYVSTATLSVHANVRVDVVFNPGEIDFGLVQHGQSPSKYIDVEYAGSFPWELKEIIKSKTAPFELKWEDLHSRAGKGYRIIATLNPAAASGTFKQEIILKTNDPASPTLTFNVLGNIQATLSVVPELVKMNDARIGETEKKSIVVRGARPFRILSIDGQDDGITAIIPDRSAQTQIVEIRFQPARAGELKTQLIIRTDLNNNEAVRVTVQGNGT